MFHSSFVIASEAAQASFALCGNGFCRNAVKHPQLAGKCACHAAGGIHHNADDGNLAFSVGNPHAPHDVAAIFMQKIVHCCRLRCVLNDNADNGNAIFHNFFLLIFIKRYPKNTPNPLLGHYLEG